MTSLEEIAAGSDEAGEEIFLFHDVLSNDGEDPSTKAARRLDWQEFVTALPERERKMVQYLIEGKTLRSLGHLLGVGDTGSGAGCLPAAVLNWARPLRLPGRRHAGPCT